MGNTDNDVDDCDESDNCPLEEASQADVDEAIEAVEDREGIVVGS
ncbi:hypothetical protein [Natronoglomus mannanivorans]|uniref:Uncharacterized protein n=1 Tax=Natronoglomus mannanivorans TaxID=2979990 RepID=A0AAP3E1L7_9EURY|nr:hypothetical protein [Halobacteria archaeon AArc-xg1-1]